MQSPVSLVSSDNQILRDRYIEDNETAISINNDTDYEDDRIILQSKYKHSSIPIQSLDFHKSSNQNQANIQTNLVSSSPIMIDGDNDPYLQTLNGSGTLQDPYEITSLNITNNIEDSIQIYNFTAYLTIHSNYFSSNLSQRGIDIRNSKHIAIEKNVFNNLNNSVRLSLTSDITIQMNHMQNTKNSQIVILNSNNSIISNNYIENSQRAGVVAIDSEEIVVANNTITQASVAAITVIGGKNEILYNNTVSDILVSGIQVTSAINITSTMNILSNTNDAAIQYSSSYSSIIGNNYIQNTSGWATIGLSSSYEISISENTLLNNGQNAILMQQSSEIEVIHNNCTNNGGDGITLLGSDIVLIVNNTLRGNQNYGLVAYSSSNDISINNNTIVDSGWDNLHISGVEYFTVQFNIISSTVNYRSYNGNDILHIHGSNNGIISNNTLTSTSSSTYNGIYGEDISENYYSSNYITLNHGLGMNFQHAYHSQIINNTLEGEYNDDIGISFECIQFAGYSQENKIMDNECNGGNMGLQLRGNAIENYIGYNTFTNLNLGVLLQDYTNYNVLEFNLILENTEGIDVFSSYNVFRGNIIQQNFGYGLRLFGSSYLNDFHFNSFIDNNYGYDFYHIFDDGTFNLFRFNYYDRMEGTDIGGIFDGEYSIYSFDVRLTNTDQWPLTSTYDHDLLDHLFVDLDFLYPDSSAQFYDFVTIIWRPAMDTELGYISYSLFISLNEDETWINIANSISENTYVLQLSNVVTEDSGQFWLKVIANTDSGATQIEAVSENIHYGIPQQTTSISSSESFTTVIKISYPQIWITVVPILILAKYDKKIKLKYD